MSFLVRSFAKFFQFNSSNLYFFCQYTSRIHQNCMEILMLNKKLFRLAQNPDRESIVENTRVMENTTVRVFSYYFLNKSW